MGKDRWEKTDGKRQMGKDRARQTGPVPTNQLRSFGLADGGRAARVQEDAGRSVREDRKKADQCVSFVEIRLFYSVAGFAPGRRLFRNLIWPSWFDSCSATWNHLA